MPGQGTPPSSGFTPGRGTPHLQGSRQAQRPPWPGYGEQDPPFQIWAIQEPSSLWSPSPLRASQPRGAGRVQREGAGSASASLGQWTPVPGLCVRPAPRVHCPRPQVESAALPRPLPALHVAVGSVAHGPPERLPGSLRPCAPEAAPPTSHQGCPFGGTAAGEARWYPLWQPLGVGADFTSDVQTGAEGQAC